MAVNVTAVDAYGNAWAAGEPAFALACAACANTVQLAADNGRSDFSFTIRTAGSYSFVIATAGGAEVASVPISVVAAAFNPRKSAITGPLVLTAGDTHTFSLAPYDDYGNAAAAVAGSGADIAFEAVLRDTLGGVEHAANATARAGDAYDLQFAPQTAGLYEVVVMGGEAVLSVGSANSNVFPEARHGPVEVAGGALDAAASFLEVRGHRRDYHSTETNINNIDDRAFVCRPRPQKWPRASRAACACSRATPLATRCRPPTSTRTSPPH